MGGTGTGLGLPLSPEEGGALGPGWAEVDGTHVTCAVSGLGWAWTGRLCGSDLLEHLSLSAPLSPAASQPSSAFLSPGNLTAGRGPLHAVARGVSVGMASGEGHSAISWVRKKVKNRPQGSAETEVKVMATWG